MDRKHFTKYICDEFLESKEMAQHVMKRLAESNYEELYDIYRIIISSRAPLDKKAQALETLCALGMEDGEDDWEPHPAKLARETRLALEETQRAQPGTVFLLKQYRHLNFNEDDRNNETSGPLFTAFDEALAFIRNEAMATCEADDPPVVPSDDINGWNEIERWDMTDDNRMELTISWELSYTGIIWSVIWEDSAQEESSLDALYGVDLNLSTPFTSGDLIVADARPFFDVTLGIILDAENQADCCSPLCLFIGKPDANRRFDSLRQNEPPTAAVTVCALKHWPFSFPRFSPLLRARYATTDDIMGVLDDEPQCNAVSMLSTKIRNGANIDTDKIFRSGYRCMELNQLLNELDLEETKNES